MSISYGRQSINKSDVDAVSEAVEADWLTMGPTVEDFEDAISLVAGTKYSAAMSSGTAALHAAYFAAGISMGDEIITSPLTFIATASMAKQLGAEVKFVDVEADSGNIDPQKAKAAITSRTKAIVAVDYAGNPCDYAELRKICDESKILFIVDCAHSLHSTFQGKPVGAFADIVAFSFFPTKNITTGEGGAVSTNNPEFWQRAKSFRSHGLQEPQNKFDAPWLREVHEFGMNYRLSDVLCSLGISQISRITDFKLARQRIFDFYCSNLDLSKIKVPSTRQDTSPMWHLFPIRVPRNKRLELYKHLHKNGIYVQVNYIPAYLHPVFKKQGHVEGECPIAEEYYAEELSLPMHVELSDKELIKICGEVNSFL